VRILFERTAVAIVRVWMEGPHRDLLRVRVTTINDIADGERRTTAAASVDEAISVVRRWLQGIEERRDGRPTAEPGPSRSIGDE
jgi:hypothetical protein